MGRDIEVVEFNGLKTVKFPGACAQSFSNVDIYLTNDWYEEVWGDYNRQVPRYCSSYPSDEKAGDDSLDNVLALAWPNSVPGEIRKLISGRKTAVFEGHGSTYRGVGWAVIMEGSSIISIQRLFDEHLADYDVVMFAVCNPARLPMQRQHGTLIYPLGNFGPERDKFEMAVAGNN